MTDIDTSIPIPTVWRLNIKTAAKKDVCPREFCLDKKILGVGWPVDDIGSGGWKTYQEKAEQKYGKMGRQSWRDATRAIHDKMKIGDLCWTRNLNGDYYLGRVTGEWEYYSSQEYKDADIANTRNCEWLPPVTVDSVPGKIVNSFRNRTIQRVGDESAAYYSIWLYNDKTNSQLQLPTKEERDVFSLISSDDCEDIVALYLQEKGYRLVSSSCKKSTTHYEFVLKHRETGNRALAQVKIGVRLNPSDYASKDEEYYLFSTSEEYGKSEEGVTCLTTDDLKSFIDSNPKILSGRIQNWIKIQKKMFQTMDFRS